MWVFFRCPRNLCDMPLTMPCLYRPIYSLLCRAVHLRAICCPHGQPLRMASLRCMQIKH